MCKVRSLYWKFTLFILLVLVVKVSYACKCDEVNVKDAVRCSDVILKGTIIAKTVTADLSAYGVIIAGDTHAEKYSRMQYPHAVCSVQVMRWYKGKSTADTIIVLTPRGGAACGVSFQIGQCYIIYGTKKDVLFSEKSLKRFSTSDKTYWTHSCSRTEVWFASEEKEIIAETE